MLKGTKIYLRTIEPEDAEYLLALENNTSNWRVSNTVVPFSKALIVQYVESAQDIFTVRQIRFMVCLNDSNEVIGTVDLFDYEPIHQRAGVGILIEAEYRGEGVAIQALQLLSDYALNAIGLRNLYASIMANNLASNQLFLKVGYTKVGVRKDWYNIQGDWIDENLYQKELV